MLINRCRGTRSSRRPRSPTLDRGWRRIVTELGIEFLHPEALESSARPARTSRTRSSSSTPTSSSSRSRRRRASSTCRRATPSAASTSAATTWSSRRSTAARSCATGRAPRRDADDFENLVRLAQAFPQLDSPGGTICEPNDLPLDSRHLDMVFALLSLSDKPFMGSVTSGPNAADTIAMAEIVFGRESIEQTPARSR